MFKIKDFFLKKVTDRTDFKLGLYYYVIELTGIFIPFSVAILVIYFPSLFTWFEHPREVFISSLSITIVQAVFFLLYLIFSKDYIFNLNRYIYVVFFIYFIYITGALDSSFIFLLFFPLITSVIYLDKKATRNMGIIVTISTFLMILFYDKNSITYALLVKDILQTVLVGTISFYIYQIVIETLKQKYERDQVSKKLIEMIRIDSLKNDFLSVAQHQLRTPLSGIKWALESLKSDTTLKDDTMSIINAGLERIKDSISIINNMLQTIEDKNNDAIFLKKENTDIDGLIRTILAELNFIILKKNEKVIFDNSYPVMIFADRNKMKAALNNIIDNSIKYSPNGRISISIKENEKDIVLEVKDNGIGIIEDDLPYIFDRLHRGKNAVMIEPDESGVGLYTSKKVIELHGGSIRVSSKVNEGTTITVTLPK